MNPTVQAIVTEHPGATFEHTGGGNFTLTVGPFQIGPFHQDGTPIEAAVTIMDELDYYETCETLEAVLAILKESISDAQISEPKEPGDATECFKGGE